MTELLLKLIDKVIELAKRREAQRVELFKHFVEPAWKDLESVHDNYLQTFRKYLELVADPTLEFNDRHAVFRMIETDSLFSEAVRARLAEVSRLQIEDKRVQAFVRAIVTYLCSVPEDSTLRSASPTIVLADSDSAVGAMNKLVMMCLPRISLRHELHHSARRDLTASERRALACVCIRVATEELQRDYRVALTCFTALKIELLRHTSLS